MVTRQVLVWIEITIAFYSSAEMLKSATFFAWPQGAARPSTASGLVFLTTYTVGNCIHFYDILLGASQDRLALLQVVIAGILQLIAHAIWYWTRRTVKPKQLTVALARDVPATLISRGAYAYVRHPFYAAYMLCYGAASVLANSPRGYIIDRELRGSSGGIIDEKMKPIRYSIARMRPGSLLESILSPIFRLNVSFKKD